MLPKKRKTTKSLKWENKWDEEDNPLIDDEFDLEKLRLDILSLIKNKIANYNSKDEWHKSTDKKRIKLLLKDRKKKKGWKYNIERPLSNVLKDILERVYIKYFSKKKKMSKRTRVNELVASFYDEESPLDKREEEEANIQAIGNIDEEFRFLELCGMVLPREIPTMIFEFIERNYYTLTTIGLTCQFFYVSLLTTWNEISVHKWNLFKISLLALKRVKILRIRNMTQVELEYLWKHVSNSRLRTLKIVGKSGFIRSTFAVLQKIKKKRSTNPTNYPLQNVTEYAFCGYYWGKKVREFSAVYNDLFPNLRKVSGDFSREFSTKLLERSPRINEIGIADVFSSDYSIRNSGKQLQMLKQYSNPKQIKKLHILSFDVQSNYGKFIALEELGRILKIFKHLETFTLTTRTSGIFFHMKRNTERRVFDLNSFFSHFEEEPIRKISIIEREVRNHLIYPHEHEHECIRMRENHEKTKLSEGEDNSIRVIYSNDIKVEKLEILSFQIGYSYLHVLDFNLEEMISTNFLLNPSLKSFKGDVALGKRSRNINYLISTKERMTLENELIKIVEVGQKFLRFLRDSMVTEFKKFEIIVRSNDTYFEDEYISVQYDQSESDGIRRLRIGYSAGYCKSEKDSLKTPLDIRFLNDEMDRTFCDNGELARIFLMKEKRPCLMIFHAFIEVTMMKMCNQIDLFCFFVGKDDKKCRNAWKTYFLNLIQEKEEVGDQSIFLKDFVFSENDLIFSRKYLS